MSRNPEKNLCNRNQSNHSARKLNAIALACAAFALSGITSTAVAQPTENPSSTSVINLPAQGLQETLNALSRQFGTGIGAETSLLQNKTVPALQGSYSLQQVLNTILPSNGLRAVRSGAAWTVVAAPTSNNSNNALPEVVVTAAPISAATEGTGSYTAQTVAAGGKMGESLREVPRSVSVITRQQLDDQRITSFNEALEQLPGVTLVPGSGIARDMYYTRGYEISQINVDGSPSRSFAGSTDNSGNTGMVKYDNIQLLRGPDGIFSGNGQPSGTINLTRKKPTDSLELKTSLSAGSWQNYYGDVDISSPLNAAGTVRGRLVVAHNDSEKFYDYAQQKKSTLYAIVDVAPAQGTLLSAGFSFDRNRGASDYGPSFPRFHDGTPLHLSPSYGSPKGSGSNDSDATNYFVTLEQELGSRWKAKANLSKTSTRGEPFSATYTGAVDPVTGEGSRLSYASAFFYDFDYDAADVTLNGSFDLLGRTHKLAFGADYQKGGFDGTYSGPTTGSNAINWNTFDPALGGAHPGLSEPSWIYQSYTRQAGLYGYGWFKLADPLAIVIGGRYASIKSASATRLATAAEVWNTSLDNDGVFTPYYSLIYDVNDQWSTYLTLANSYEDQSNYISSSLEPLGPTRGRSVELGVKGEFYEGRLNTNVTVYRTKRDNYRVSVGRDSNYGRGSANPGKNCCYSGDGKFLAQGVEFDVSGQLLPNLQINAGYTYDDNKTEYGDNDGKRYASHTPKHTFRLWSSYRLQGDFSGWKFGGGVKAQSSYFRSGDVNTWNPSGGENGNGAWDGPTQPFAFTESGRAIWNAFVDYQLNPQWALSLNVNNVFNKRYFASVGDINGGNMYGAPRSWLLTLRGSF